MANNDIIVLLLIAMAIVLTIELIYIAIKKKRRKEEMSLFKKSSEPVEPLADKAHNTILTTEGISSALARQGLDTGEADSLIHEAKSLQAMKNYETAIERADAAKLVLLRVKREAAARPQKNIQPHPDPGMRPMNESLFKPADLEPMSREEKSLDTLPANYVQSKFMLSTTKDLLEKKGITSGEAFEFYTSALRFFENEDYTKALSHAIKAEKILDSGTLMLIGEAKIPSLTEEVIEVLVCPGCEAEISQEDVFCRGCGQNLETSLGCPGCGVEIDSSDKFCRKCGYKLK
jgi:ribosomal protein L40E